MAATSRMTFKEMVNVSGGILIALWVILFLCYLFEHVFHYPLQHKFGIRPRDTWGLIGIPCSPFLHANMGHLIANMSGLLILGLALMALEGRKALFIVGTIVVFGGLGTWLIGNGQSVHVGASGVVFGLIGYLIAAGWYKRTTAYIMVAIAVLTVYGGVALWGVLPIHPGISWEGHLCGFLAGVADAKFREPEKVAA